MSQVDDLRARVAAVIGGDALRLIFRESTTPFYPVTPEVRARTQKGKRGSWMGGLRPISVM